MATGVVTTAKEGIVKCTSVETALAAWREQGRALAKVDNARQFEIGDWLLAGEVKLARKVYTEAANIFTGYRHSTLKLFSHVARQVPPLVRTNALPWEHHKLVAHFKPELQQVLLARAAETGMHAKAFVTYIHENYPPEKSAPAAMPDGTYRIVYADPPWQYGNCFPPGMIKTALDHYPTMPLEDICAMHLPKIADNAVLFLWATAPMLENAFQVIRRWEFAYKTEIVWNKLKHNVGHYTSVRHESLLLATRGSCLPDCKELINSVQTIERTAHSRKPEQFRAIIDKLYLGPRIELFARGVLPAGWDGFGNEYVADREVAA